MLVLRTVHLRNHDAVDALETLRELLVNRSNLLAVPAPRRVHLKKHILRRVLRDLVHGASHHNPYATLVHLSTRRRRRTLHVRRQLARIELLHERLEAIFREWNQFALLVRHAVLLRRLRLAIESNNRGIIARYAKVFRHLRSLLSVRVHGNRDELATVLLRHLEECIPRLLALVKLISGREQDHLPRHIARVEDLPGIILAEELNPVEPLKSKEALQSRGASASVSLVNLVSSRVRADDDDVAQTPAVRLAEFRVGRLRVRRPVHLARRILVGGVRFALQLREAPENDGALIFVRLGDHLVKCLGCLHRLSWRSRALLHPRHDGVGIPSAFIFDGISVNEPLERRVSLDIVILSDVTLFRGVHLGEHDLHTLLLERGCRVGILRLERLAVSTPRRVELDENKLVLFECAFKVVGRQHEHILFVNVGIVPIFASLVAVVLFFPCVVFVRTQVFGTDISCGGGHHRSKLRQPNVTKGEGKTNNSGERGRIRWRGIILISQV
mmetsp:Transcript_13359/g.30600  ORF Transcript_13359/g.30600 Transcript_13359/m.30600 type:complete len:500 (+) Transcript_13359:290-1789(+)